MNSEEATEQQPADRHICKESPFGYLGIVGEECPHCGEVLTTAEEEPGNRVYEYLRFYLGYRLLPGVLALMAFFMGLNRGAMPDEVKLHWAIFAVGMIFGAYLFEVYLQVSGGVRYEF